MKILITGGAGFIGSHVVNAYIEAGHEVVVIDNLSSGTESRVHPKAKFYQMDIRSDELEAVFARERPDVVNHHAAQKSVPKSVEDPRYDAEFNVMGLLNLLECCRKHGVHKFIFISSGGALAGDAPVIPTDENVNPVMISPYAIHKYVGEKYLHFYRVTYNLHYTVLRYANVYGPNQIADGECGVIPIFMNNILSEKPSTVFAYADQPRGTTRDYVYVEDVAEANILALTGANDEILNIGSGDEIHTEDVYHLIARIAGSTLPLHHASERVGDVRRSVLDCTKAKEVLGWTAKTSLEEGVKKTLDWLKSERA
ncbi:NAD-dependent epimerase/dehydratase family protein [Alicyclobacillus fastidiosus]|uniref:NAD-dependent epimerase/dehydratase family protein n=1 Tax=Alicyclobacillus fastidiosus TaxID=392011 RepID=A0ABV5AHD8_9BACL|nr:NAD-dependent epimerase/dehydratase family protein [Alicyclobacillus fastidiosus]WEH09212.1 NAD-dependent epimerase/dehydratase family protein [Alicyclobacillus fastidiosus]